MTQPQTELQDARIMSKVNAVHREAFKEKFPGQCEHLVRLTAERLQAVLTKRAVTDVANPATWACTPREIADLAIALENLYSVYEKLRYEQSLHTSS
ncbi:hypothetical protein UFOVP849_23 [uncultured Caudovirales phage]|uniref:Uncharacterized protein n=1 Tax=uncultured Caudovirales phage TaxID=2100421 RepID=A0A6J5P5D0_9CAUD|nr:hypothetical protein UFOVP849_23 [uncultured Caudovirales phage]